MSWWSREGQIGPTESPEPGSSRKAQTKSHITLSQVDLFPLELNMHYHSRADQTPPTNQDALSTAGSGNEMF